MRRWKREITEEIELPNQDGIRTLGENENYKYLAILEVDIIKAAEMKEKSISDERESFSKPKSAAGISSKGKTPGLFSLVWYSGPFFQRTREELNKWTRRQENRWRDTKHYFREMT